MQSVGITVNGSTNAVSACGSRSMSLSLIACQPRMLEPSKPRPSSNTSSSSLRDGDGEVLPDAGEIHEPQVDGLDVAFAAPAQTRAQAGTSNVILRDLGPNRQNVQADHSQIRIQNDGTTPGGQVPALNGVVAFKGDQVLHSSRVPIAKVHRRPFDDGIHFFLGPIREKDVHVVLALRIRINGCADVRSDRTKSRGDEGIVFRAEPGCFRADALLAAAPMRKTAGHTGIDVVDRGVVHDELRQAVCCQLRIAGRSLGHHGNIGKHVFCPRRRVPRDHRQHNGDERRPNSRSRCHERAVE